MFAMLKRECKIILHKLFNGNRTYIPKLEAISFTFSHTKLVMLLVPNRGCSISPCPRVVSFFISAIVKRPVYPKAKGMDKCVLGVNVDFDPH